MIFSALRAIIGILFALFIPGYLLTRIIFNEIESSKGIAFSLIFSLAISISLGFFLGANETMANITGGITEFNVWYYLIILSIILGFIFVLKEKGYLSKK